MIDFGIAPKTVLGGLWDSKRGPRGEGPKCVDFAGGGPFISDITYLMTYLAERQRSMPSHAVAQERGGGYLLCIGQ